MAKLIKYQCKNCGKEKTFQESQLKHYPNRGRFCSKECMYEYKRKNPTFVRSKTSHGYFTMRIGNKKVYEHRYKVEQELGRELYENETVHHINGNKQDNRIENLIVMMNSDHHKLHAETNPQNQKTGICKKCEYCGKEFYVIKCREKIARYCKHSCYAKDRASGKFSKV